MIQLKPTPLYVVKVPEDATDIEITFEEEYGLCTLIYWDAETDYSEALPERVELIGTYQSGKIDFDAGEHVETIRDDFMSLNRYPDYEGVIDYYFLPVSSFESLLQKNQVPIRDNEKWVILKLK